MLAFALLLFSLVAQTQQQIGPFTDIDPDCLETDGGLITRIVGGFPVKSDDSFPFVVSLQSERSSNKGYFQHFCGGAMFQEGLILTAAHCIWDKSRDSDLRKNNQAYEGELSLDVRAAIAPFCRHQAGEYGRLKIEKYYIHENYDGTASNGYDIAILKLEDGAGYQGPFPSLSDSTKPANSPSVLIIGYGLTSFEEATRLSVFRNTVMPLQQAFVNAMDDSVCDQEISFDVDASSQFCARGAEGTIADTCGGDSGGPILSSESNPVLLGITSWGQDNECQGSTIGVYSSVGAAQDWINKVLSQSSATCSVAQNANAKGDSIDDVFRRANSIEECCQKCHEQSQCNVFVYCPREAGCRNGGETLQYSRCDLKYQDRVANGNVPEYWSTGSSVDFSSGHILGKAKDGTISESSGGSSSSQCTTVQNANAKGDLVSGKGSLRDQTLDSCCQKCNEHSSCNVFVFCGKQGGCNNWGEIIPQGQCDLKYQYQVSQNTPPEYWSQGSGTDFTAGYILGKA
eukprot:TRINITY_DN1152_c0_g1_i2.p1 TRINITY_DN1152_c0_g1~~TRINITY_DN1152_c0_g1_i2.p1  ORF type:complete len:514 (-),score=40.66 TRINITY_DN1152_c0_g1_i2:1547-3088(-)